METRFFKVQFSAVEFPLQAVPNQLGMHLRRLTILGIKVNISCEKIKCLSHQRNSILVIEVSFTKALKFPFDNFIDSFFNFGK